MTSVRESHTETVALIGDAVTEVTRRAIKPTLEPFTKAIGGAINRLEEQADAVAEGATQLRTEVAAAQQTSRELANRLAAVVGHQRAMSKQINRLLWSVLLLALTVGGMATVLILAAR